jgi:hypothetical protein
MEGNMKIDLYTKAILTVIAIGIGCLVFEQKPVKEAQAAVSLEKRVEKIEAMRQAFRSLPFCQVGPVRDRNGKWKSFVDGLSGSDKTAAKAAAVQIDKCFDKLDVVINILR